MTVRMPPVQSFGYVDTLANGLLISVHDSAVEDAIFGEPKCGRGVSSISSGVSPAVQ